MVYFLHKRKKIKKWLLGGIILLGIFWLYLFFNQVIKTYWPENIFTRTAITIDFPKETLEQLQKHNIEVNSIEERDSLPEKDIIYEDRIFDRVEGLRVYVLQPIENYDKNISGIYELVDGITNEHWKKNG